MRSALLLAGVVLALGVACSGKTLPYAGGLMIAVQTDYSVPKDITAVGLYISSDGRPIFGDTRDVAPNGEVKFPATIAVLADANRPKATVKIRAVGFKTDGEIRVLRDVITTIPKGRTGLLRTPLTWINEGSGKGNRSQLLASASIRPLDTSDGFTRIQSICPEGQTSLQGDCGDAHVDGDALPEYEEKAVFGGGDVAGNGGRCFDVLGCFASTTQVQIDPNGCTGSVSGVDPNDANLSLAVVLPGAKGIGECKDDKCFVPLDKGAGWTIENGKIVFPPAMCRKIGEGKALGIAATLACPAKDPTTPSCGLASAVAGTSTPGNPGSRPDAGTDGGSDAGTDAGNDGGSDAGISVNDFETPVAFTTEPYLSDVKVDGTYVFLARGEVQPAPPGVRRLERADVLALSTTPENVEVYGFPGTLPVQSTLVLDGDPAAHVFIRNSNGLPVSCAVGGSCFASPAGAFTSGFQNAVAASTTEGYVYGSFGSTNQLYAIPHDVPQTPSTRLTVPVGDVASMIRDGGVLFFGGTEGSIYKCDLPCNTTVTQVRPPTATPTTITALATSSKASGRLFFLQIPANASDVASAGVFEIEFDGTNERQHALGAALGISAGDSSRTALAVDGEYVYFGGKFADAQGGGQKGGLLRSSHVTPGILLPMVETVQGSEVPSAVTVDATHLFWTYYRSSNALLFAKKKGVF